MAILQLLIKIMMFIKITIVLSFWFKAQVKPLGQVVTPRYNVPHCVMCTIIFFFFKNKAKCHQTLTCQNVFETPTFRTIPAIFKYFKTYTHYEKNITKLKFYFLSSKTRFWDNFALLHSFMVISCVKQDWSRVNISG